jgi:hypothetical protein
MADYTNKKLNLSKDYLFAGFCDEDAKVVMGKIIKVGGQNKGKSWKPANLTTALLLYLLCREDNDCIPYEEFANLIFNKFDNVPEGAIEDALDKLLAKGALDNTGNSFAGISDPLNLFNGSKLDWEEPALIVSKDSDCKNKHHYSKGYYMITIWR